VGHVVYTSVLNPATENPFPPAEWQRRSEDALRATGVPWTILRNALYADLRVDIAVRYLEEGRWTTNIGGGAHAFVTRADCAATAAGVLTGQGHEGRIYDVTGPELVTAAAYRDLLQEIGRRPIELRNVDDEEYEEHRTRFMADSRNTTFFELFTRTGRAIREGFLNQVGPAVRELTGREPTRLRDRLAASLAHQEHRRPT
jgi:NAD(P)H dehydrogenase (quinone)